MGNEAAEKTEEATTRRRTKERERGNVSKSKDMESAMVMVGGIALLGVFSRYIYTQMTNMLRETFSNLDPASIDTTSIVGILYPYFRYLGIIVLPFLIFLAIFAVIVIRMDVGQVFALSKVKIDLNNLSPKRMLENAKRIVNPFQPRSMVEFAKSILKLVIVGACGFSAINSRKGDLLGLVGLDFPIALNIIGSILVNMIINMCLAMLILGYLDKKYQNYEYEKSIKMTRSKRRT